MSELTNDELDELEALVASVGERTIDIALDASSAAVIALVLNDSLRADVVLSSIEPVHRLRDGLIDHLARYSDDPKRMRELFPRTGGAA